MNLLIEKYNENISCEELFSIFKDDPYTVILDSSLNNGGLGKYSIILSNPFLIFKSKGNNCEIKELDFTKQYLGDPFEEIKKLINKYKMNSDSILPCANGCCAGFMSYDLCEVIEELPSLSKEHYDIPHMMFGFYNSAIIIDHDHSDIYISLVNKGRKQKDQTHLKKEINSMINRIRTSHRDYKIKRQINEITQILDSEFTKEEYCELVQKAREYIRNGDIFQVNLSQRFRTRLTNEPYRIYENLRRLSPAPFSSYISFEDIAVLSSSPERFIKVEKGIVQSRPIKGTRPRGRDIIEDNNLKKDLLNSHKDRAELTMIVDLVRNDLGRVCEIGSVKVEKLFEIEEYANVFHLVSTITGKLKKDAHVVDCLKAAFPGGSITGAPKIRSMEIIDELEPCKRGIYTGSIGYIGFDGNSDFNIAIRTITIKDGDAFYNVGGGIVWDSVPKKEYQETLDKGMAMMKVLRM
ncbi:UNVERIFIED_CONTAM: aminodeoxychorismate synthase subunit I [Acetivibrio alkalicellulosi]